MTFFGALIKTLVNTATLPVNVVKDVVMAVPDSADSKLPGSRTIANVKRIKDEASE